MTGKTKEIVKKRPPIASSSNRAIADYFLSKKFQENVIKNYPELNDLRGDTQIEQSRAIGDLWLADLELDIKRHEYKTRRETLKRQWNELRQQEERLRSSFVQFDEFVRENREKRERAERKIVDEKERQRIREAEIIVLENNLECLEIIRDRMKSYVEAYRPFQDYLEQIVEAKEFNSIAGIFNRYEALSDAKHVLEDHRDRNLHILETTTAQLQQMTKEKSQNLMDLNSRLAELQSRYEQSRAKTLHWETMVSRIKEVSAQKELEETQVRACIWNLYQQICRRKGVQIEANRTDLEKQLQHIKSTIIELGKIVRAAKRKTAREKKEKETKAKAKIEVGAVKRDDEKTSARSSYFSGMDDRRSVFSIMKKY